MKRFAILSLVVSLLASMFIFSSCTDPENQPETTGTETEPQESVSENVTEPDTEPTAQLPAPFETVVRDTYTITSENGKAVVRFTGDAGSKLPTSSLQVEGFGFSSVDAYRETLLKGTLEDWKLASIKIWEDRYGNPVSLPDPDLMIGLQLPDGWVWDGSFTIDGEAYSCPITSPEGFGSVRIMYNEVVTYEMLVDRIQKDYIPEGYEGKACTYLGVEGISAQYDTRSATLLDIKADVSGILSTGDKQFVGMYYRLETTSSLKATDEYPAYISFVGMTENGTLYEVGWFPKCPVTKELHEILRPEK